jgi:hypothetical protein
VKLEHPGSEVNGHNVGYWVGFVDTRVLEHNGGREALANPQLYGSM